MVTIIKMPNRFDGIYTVTDWRGRTRQTAPFDIYNILSQNVSQSSCNDRPECKVGGETIVRAEIMF